jgi:tetratricopeptide (TPR) repeat protein
LGDMVGSIRPEEAIALYRRSLAMTSALLENAPGSVDFRRYQALGSMGMAKAFSCLKRYDEALGNLRSSLAALEELGAQDRAKLAFAQDIRSNLIQTGDLLMEQRNFPSALESYVRALRIAQSVLAASPLSTYSRRDLADVHERLGHYHSRIAAERRGREERKESWTEARNCYGRAMGIWEEWSSETPNPYIRTRKEQTAWLIQKCETQLARNRGNSL